MGSMPDWSNMFFKNESTPVAGWNAFGSFMNNIAGRANETQGQKNLAYGGMGYDPSLSDNPSQIDTGGGSYPAIDPSIFGPWDPNAAGGGGAIPSAGGETGSPGGGGGSTVPGSGVPTGGGGSPAGGGYPTGYPSSAGGHSSGGAYKDLPPPPNPYIGGAEWNTILKAFGGDATKAKAYVEKAQGNSDPYSAFAQSHDAGQAAAVRASKGLAADQTYYGTNPDGSNMTAEQLAAKKASRPGPDASDAEMEAWQKGKGWAS